jgi:hypothetical protein
MNNSSAPPTYYTTSNDIGYVAQEIQSVLPDVITLDTATMANISAAAGGVDTITISNGGSSSYYFGGSGSGTITFTGSSGVIGGAGTSTFNWKLPEEFVDAFPDFNKIKQMCDEYPGLKIAYEKFVTTYKLVKDHYDTPEDQRPRP